MPPMPTTTSIFSLDLLAFGLESLFFLLPPSRLLLPQIYYNTTIFVLARTYNVRYKNSMPFPSVISKCTAFIFHWALWVEWKNQTLAVEEKKKKKRNQ